MKLLSEFVEGIKILSKYYENPDGDHLDADHDVIYLYPTHKSVSEEDLKILFDLGFIQENGACNKHPEKYDPHEGWKVYA